MKGQVGGFQNPGLCLEAFPSFPSPSLAFLCLALAPFFARVKHRKSCSSVFLCSPTPRKRLLRRIVLSCTDKRKFEVSGAGNVTGRMKCYLVRLCIYIWQGCSPETELNPDGDQSGCGPIFTSWKRDCQRFSVFLRLPP